MSEIRLAVAGVGNCASALIQGVAHYSTGENSGLMHERLDDYEVGDITPVCGFDIDERKVGRDLSTAIFQSPNCAEKFAEVSDLDAPVYRGPALDGISEHTQEYDRADRVAVDEAHEPVSVAETLRKHDVDVLVCYLPVGASAGVKHYAEACLTTGIAMVNAVPVFVASDKAWAERFDQKGVPIVGDDIKSQIGATITHRSLVQLMQERGVDLTDTYQLNVGGNTDFLNMLNRDRLASKKTSKTTAVNDVLDEPLDDSEIHIGPSDYVDWLEDQKTAFIRLEGHKFGDVSVEIDMKLRVQDSPNSAGSVVDAVRCAKIAQDRSIGGPLRAASAFTMKHPPEDIRDSEAKREIRAFASGEQPT